MALKIIEFLDKFKNPKLSKDIKIDEYIADSNKEVVNQLLLLNTKEDSIPIIFLSYSERYLNILNKLKAYVLSIKQVIDKSLKFTKLEQDYYILLFISLEINYIIEKEKCPIFKDEILEYIKEPIISENNDIDSSKYKLDKIAKELKESLKNRVDYKKKYFLIPYLKLEYSNTNNYIYYNMKFIKQFNKKVSKSKTISSLLNYLFPGYTDFNLFEGEFMDTFFENAINNCYFYPFFYQKVGAYTFKRNNQIIFFVPNRSKISEKLLDVTNNYYKYLISNLGCFIYIEYHELFGYYLRELLSKITDMEYQSPSSKISNKNESGEYIELLLFGSRVRFFTLKQLVFILDINNYNQNYTQFRENYINIRNYSPSKECEALLGEIGIKLSNIILCDEENVTAALFGVNESINYENDEKIEVPFLEECIDNIYELNNLDTNYISDYCKAFKRLLKLKELNYH